MHSVADQAFSTNQDVPSLASRVRGILSTIAAEASAGEAGGKLTEKTLAALNSCNLFGLLVPKSLGGYEAGAVDAMRIWEMVAEADGATGWVLMACCAGTGVTSALLPEASVQTVFRGRMPIIGGQGAPRGKAKVEGDGYRVSGKWAYGSGTLHAEYVMSAAMVMNQDGSPGGVLAFIVPRNEVQFDGNWDVLGLRATGSVDYSLNDVYVPKDYTLALDLQAPLRGNNLLRAGVAGTTPLGHSGFTLGIGRRILNDIAALANSSDGRPSALADSGDIFQQGYGSVEGKFRAGRAFVYEICEEVDQTIAKGDPITTRQITLIRLALLNVTAAVEELANFAYRAAGGVALHDGSLQRSVRDVMAATQHRIVSNYLLRECASELLGKAKGKVWMSSSGGGLIDPSKAAATNK